MRVPSWSKGFHHSCLIKETRDHPLFIVFVSRRRTNDGMEYFKPNHSYRPSLLFPLGSQCPVLTRWSPPRPAPLSTIAAFLVSLTSLILPASGIPFPRSKGAARCVVSSFLLHLTVKVFPNLVPPACRLPPLPRPNTDLFPPLLDPSSGYGRRFDSFF